MITKPISPSKLKELITKRNKAFEGKTNAEKRVLIAKDVLQQIRKGFFVPERKGFVNINTLGGTTLYSPLSGSEEEQNVRELLMAGSTGCECCALGGLMLSCTLFNNKTMTSDSDLFYIGDGINAGHTFSNGLTEIFDRCQLELIENAYELGRGYFKYFVCKSSDMERNKAIKFGQKYVEPKDRLRAIMKNIIKNKGDFIP